MSTFLGYACVTALLLMTGRHYVRQDLRVALIAVMFLVFAPLGQALEQSHLTYPFDHWTMYASPTPAKIYHRFIVRTANGASYDYPFAGVALSSPGPLLGYSSLSPLMMRLLQLQGACRCRENDDVLDRSIDGLLVIHAPSAPERIVGFEIVDEVPELKLPGPQTGVIRYKRSLPKDDPNE